jgi:hypothetical protein
MKEIDHFGYLDFTNKVILKWIFTDISIGNSSVVIATSCMAGVRIPIEARFFSHSQGPDRLWGPPGLVSSGYQEGELTGG